MTRRDRIVIMVVLAVGAIVAAWMFVISPKRDQAAQLSSQISSARSQFDSARSQVAAGQAARIAFAGQYAQLAKLGEAVPPDDDIPSLIYQVQSAAQAAHVSFSGLQLTAGGSSSSTTSTAGSATSGAGSTTGAAGGSPSGASSSVPPGAVVGAAGLPTEQFSFTLAGDFFHLADFFNRVQNFVISRDNQLLVSGRLMTINGISLQPGQGGFPQMTASVSATTYIVPATEGPLGGATAAGPATSSQAQASTSGSSTATPAHAPTSGSSTAAPAAITPPLQ